MADTLVHRGPDDHGVWADPDSGVTFGHRRLAIIDLSPQGQQPMHSADGRYVLVFNGEIYNHRELRAELTGLGQPFRGHSDTEVMLAAFSHWGVEPALGRFHGMFAFALWDRHRRRLTLGRDRLGEKPLYYGWLGSTFVFGSELKAFAEHPAWDPEISRDSLVLFLRYSYIPAPHSIYRGLFKLPPAAYLQINSSQLEALQGQRGDPISYWSAREVAEQGAREPFAGSADEAVSALDEKLGRIIRRQMVADVPVGAFLSGGLDSSTVVALMQAAGTLPVRTFTIGFHEREYDEAQHASAIARHLGCDHTELYISPDTAMSAIIKLPRLYDEPLADSSQIPTFLVSQLAREDVTVVLSGDGGDEIFGGYGQYEWGRRIWRWLERMPRGVKAFAARRIGAVSPERWNAVFARLPLVRFPYFAAGDTMHRLARVLDETRGEGLYKHLMSRWQDPAAVVLGGREPQTLFDTPQDWARVPDLFAGMMYVDMVTRLPNAYLTKVDRATMGVSLECRAPLLDHEFIEYCWSLPLEMKTHGRSGKVLLRRLLERYVPASLTDRPKQGFSIPLAAWLRDPRLRDWIEQLLGESRLRADGFFEPAAVRRKWEEHRSGRHNWQLHLWNVLMFQAWLDATRSAPAGDVPVFRGKGDVSPSIVK